ncbi:MAG: hypothetical protein MUC92_08915 [Fimbriimonadaceae bacterium]|jgi:hypothetical protein|nr:hypothetical protein [Fimbriimonadaceae bacterium]
MATPSSFWHDDWDLAKERWVAWWEQRGPALRVVAPKDEPWESIPAPIVPATLHERWTNPEYRAHQSLYELANTYYGGIAFPMMNVQLGAGSLGVLLGSKPEYAENTVWFHPCLDDLENDPPLSLNWESQDAQDHLAIIKEARKVSEGKALVCIPDLIENIDTLIQLHGVENTLYALVDSPGLVQRRIQEINDAFLKAFDVFYDLTKTEDGGSCFTYFEIWGPGKTVKVQCDAAAMLSPTNFREFVADPMREQCRSMDYPMFHLDGTQALPCLEPLLEIEEIKAIEWTPQSGIEQGGNPRWFDLYRQIKAAGKSIHCVGVSPDEVLPLLDAVGPEGVYIMTVAETETEARALSRAVYG